MVFDLHDPVSASSHLMTAVWAAYATVILLRLTRGHGVGRWAVAFYGLSMVLLYLFSGLFHGLYHESRESFSFKLFQKLDKSAIFLLIAGSFVPVIVYRLRGAWRMGSLAGMLGMAVIGIACLWLLPTIPHDLLIVIYTGMGLLGMIPARRYVNAYGWRGAGWVGAVVVCYVGGAIVEFFQWPWLVPGWIGPHEILHLADCAGTLSLFIFVTRYVIRRPPVSESPRVVVQSSSIRTVSRLDVPLNCPNYRVRP